jgi:SAM-dependent methyltransferase
MNEICFDPSYGIDWDDLWRQQLESASFRTLGAERWNAGAANWGKAMNVSSHSNYVDQLLDRMNLSPDMTVLDVGCGSGRMAIPLAKRVRHVAALDQAPAMLELTEQYAKAESLQNIKTVNVDWTKARLGIDVEPHDIVLSSSSVLVLELREFLTRMDQAAKQRCYLSWGVGANVRDARVSAVLGEKYRPQPSYVIIYNLLYSMGIIGNIEICKTTGSRKVKDISSLVRTVATEARLRNFFTQEMTCQDECYCQDMSSSMALISWSKSGPTLATAT